MEQQEQSIQFRGTLVLSDQTKVQVAVSISFDKLDTTSLDIELMNLADEGEMRRIQAKLYAERNNDIYIENARDPGAYLEIENIYGIRYSSGGLIIEANSISYGVKGCVIPPEDELYLIGWFTPGGLLGKEMTREPHHDGSVKVRKLNYKDSYWETDIGKFTISKAHRHFDGELFHRKTSTSVEVTQASLEIRSGSSIELEKVRTETLKYLQIIASALSLSFRVPVNLYQVDYMIIEKDPKSKAFLFPKVQRFKLLENQKRTLRDPLIEIRNLSGKKFGELASSIQNNCASEAIKKCIRFLALSRTKYLEESYFYCFLALDLMIEEVLSTRGIDTKIPNNTWRKIEKLLCGCIKANDNIELQNDLDEVCSKLPELKRYALAKKAAKAVQLLKVDTSGIWKKCSFSKGLEEASRIRNSLFHAGRVDSIDGMYENLIRLQFLLERIILRALKWRSSRVWIWQDQELKRINMS